MRNCGTNPFGFDIFTLFSIKKQILRSAQDDTDMPVILSGASAESKDLFALLI